MKQVDSTLQYTRECWKDGDLRRFIDQQADTLFEPAGKQFLLWQTKICCVLDSISSMDGQPSNPSCVDKSSTDGGPRSRSLMRLASASLQDTKSTTIDWNDCLEIPMHRSVSPLITIAVADACQQIFRVLLSSRSGVNWVDTSWLTASTYHPTRRAFQPRAWRPQMKHRRL